LPSDKKRGRPQSDEQACPHHCGSATLPPKSLVAIELK
jgi:hypothetical protein